MSVLLKNLSCLLGFKYGFSFPRRSETLPTNEAIKLGDPSNTLAFKEKMARHILSSDYIEAESKSIKSLPDCKKNEPSKAGKFVTAYLEMLQKK